MSTFLYLLLVGAFITKTTSYTCPSGCDCAYYNSIHTLECNSQDLQEIPQNIPEWTTLLELDANELTELDLNFCDVCIYFEDFSFRYNRISNIIIKKNITSRYDKSRNLRCQDSTSIFPRVVNVDLKGNLIQKLPKCLWFVWLVLKILDLRENQIRSIQDLNLSGYFSSTNSMEELYLGGNRISQLIRKDLYSRTLALKRLRILDLSRNKIHTIDSGVFTFLDEIVDINLSDNKIGFLSDFTFVTRGEKLETISLRRNYIDWISIHAFAGLPNLKRLDLSYNEISCLRPNTFSTCQVPNLNLLIPGLNFVNPELVHFHRRFKVNLSGLQYLQLRSNKWHCDCQLGDLISEQHSTSRIVQQTLLKCYTPMEYQNRSLSSTLALLNCQ
uniref:leucine-rich repeats and immunoglobulin-like domains protein sma-10 n=1 Tax=Styela clava TaxID=7725 RepID=UPI00193A33CB|nr:leucine-rich repeats and immunoglobulin-like domains protein sma-10 [Styela clava]